MIFLIIRVYLFLEDDFSVLNTLTPDPVCVDYLRHYTADNSTVLVDRTLCHILREDDADTGPWGIACRKIW